MTLSGEVTNKRGSPRLRVEWGQSLLGSPVKGTTIKVARRVAGDYFYDTPEERIPSTENTIYAVNPDVPNGLEAIAHGHQASFASDLVLD